MYKDILKSFKAVPVLLVVLLVGCAKSADPIHFTSKISMKDQASVTDDLTAIQVWYSTDGGANYTGSPVLSSGKKYKAKLYNTATLSLLDNAHGFQVDWTGSNPAASDPTSDSPEFTFNDPASIVAAVDDLHCTFDPASFTGVWKSTEVPVPGGCGCNSTETQNIVQDGSNPNRLIMDNFFGDGVGNATVYMDFAVSTTAHDQTILVPTQVTEEGGTAAGTGVYDQCNGVFTLHVTYDQYEWIYNFKRP